MRLIDSAEVSEFVLDVADQRCILDNASSTKNIFWDVLLYSQKNYTLLHQVRMNSLLLVDELAELSTGVLEYSIM